MFVVGDPYFKVSVSCIPLNKPSNHRVKMVNMKKQIEVIINNLFCKLSQYYTCTEMLMTS